MDNTIVDVVSYQQGNKFFIATPNNTDENFIIKGFVSVETPDRSNDLVKPAAFDIESYMAQPAVLVNHMLWSNKSGNRVGVGVPTGVHEVKLKTSDMPGMWSVWDVNNKKEIDTFPKDRNPNLGLGSRGLYAFIRLTDPDVIQMVKSGELSGFSWRGMSKPTYVHDTKTNSTYKSYSHIDLLEITLATAPNNRASSFIVAKDAVHSYQFDKSLYTTEQVQRHLTMDRVSGFTIVSDESKIYAYDMSREFDEDGLLVVKMADGANLIVGKPNQSSATLTLTEDEKKCFLQAVSNNKEPSMAVETPKVDPVVVVTPVEPVTKVTPEVVPVKLADPLFNIDEIIAKAIEAVMAKIAPVFETLTGQVQVLAQTQSDLVAKMSTAAAVVPVVESEPKPDVLADVQKQLAKFASVIENVQKGMANIIPTIPARTETAVTAKALSPNSVFDSLFGVK